MSVVYSGGSITSKIKHVDTQLRIPSSVCGFAGFMDYYTSFVPKLNRYKLQHVIQKGTQVNWKVLLAGNAGSTAYWREARVREGANQTAVVCHTDPLIPAQSFPPGQHFSQEILQKTTKQVQYFHWSVFLCVLCASSGVFFRCPRLTLYLVFPLDWSVWAHEVSLEESSF